MNDEQNIPEKSEELSSLNSRGKEKPEAAIPKIEVKKKSLQEKPLLQPETINPVRPRHPGGPKQETKTMEVHHHGHVHEKKKWKEYLIQFLMLFLAVFCGFLAEYQLEHVIENNREKEYIKSMIADLKEDTSRITRYIRVTDRFQKNREALIDVMKNDLTNPDSIKKAYELAYNYAFARAKFYFTDRTMTQLKNAGGLRLIRNSAASDSIIGYDKEIQHVEFLSDAYDIAVNEGMRDSYDIFNFSYTRDSAKFNSTDFKPALLSIDKRIIVRYLNSLIKWNAVAANYFRAINQQKERAIRLISTLEKEYDLENE